MEYRNPNDAFDHAIELGRLSADETAPNFAGLYMYMHTDSNGDHFKNIDSRQYLPLNAAGVAFANYPLPGELLR